MRELAWLPVDRPRAVHVADRTARKARIDELRPALSQLLPLVCLFEQPGRSTWEAPRGALFPHRNYLETSFYGDLDLDAVEAGGVGGGGIG